MCDYEAAEVLCNDLECCMDAMRLYKGPIWMAPMSLTSITENDPTHPLGCHVMHATGEWHFNKKTTFEEFPKFDPDLVVRGVHQICKTNDPRFIRP